MRKWFAASLAVAVLVLLLVLRDSGALSAPAVAGFLDPGAFVRWGLPISRLLLDLFGALTVGFAVTAAFGIPGDGASLAAHGYQLLRRAGWLALAWFGSAFALAALTVADLLGRPVSDLSPTVLWNFLTSVDLGKAYGLQLLGALVVAVGCRFVYSRTGALLLAGLALVTALPPAFTGHAAGAGNHQVAVTSMALHIGGAVLWLGGLAALLTLRKTSVLAVAAGRYSRMALACFVLVALSGAANAAVRLGAWEKLFGSAYGRLVLLKITALVALGVLGALHRRYTVRRLAAGRPTAFRRLAIGEFVLFTATFGLAVGLSRTPPPIPSIPVNPDPMLDRLGFAMPPEPGLRDLLGGFLPDLFFLTLVAAGIGYYLAGVWRLHRNGVRWPVGRTLSWLAGMTVLGAATNSGLAKYAYVLFSAHMMQHMILSMLIPIMLVLGAPATLALRAVRPARTAGDRGPREWLLLALHSRYLKVLTHPIVALALFIGSLYGLYFSSLFSVLMRSHLGHLGMLTHFILVGYLFFWTIIGIDPGRYVAPHPVLILAHFGGMIFHAFFGVALMQARSLIADDWFHSVRPPWLVNPLADQYLGAGITWSFGEIPSAIVFVVLVIQWIKADEREQRRYDRAADRAEAAEAAGEEADDELARYNAYLKSLPRS